MDSSIFVKNIEDIVAITKTRRDCVIRQIHNNGFTENIDFCVVCTSEKKHGGSNKYTIHITNECFNQLLTQKAIRGRQKIDTPNIKLDYIKRYLPKETETLGFVYDIFSPLYTVHKQYKVLKYRVDLYIVEKNIVIECDENNHKQYEQEIEKEREAIITKQLKCTFVRFNPDDKYFKLASIVSDIVHHTRTRCWDSCRHYAWMLSFVFVTP